MARRLLSDIIEPRVEEIFSEARRRIEETGILEQLCSGCVLTGGAALMEGMVECAEEILGMPVRLGFPVGVKGIVQLVQGPQYATGRRARALRRVPARRRRAARLARADEERRTEAHAGYGTVNKRTDFGIGFARPSSRSRPKPIA